MSGRGGDLARARRRSGKTTSVRKISIALPAEILASVNAAVDSGEFATTSEAIRDALRDWRGKRQLGLLEIGDLRRMVDEGMGSGPSVECEAVFARLRARYVTIAGNAR